MPMEDQVAIIYAAVNGYLDDIPREKIASFETDFLKYLHANTNVLKSINESGKIDDASNATLIKAIEDFKSTFVA